VEEDGIRAQIYRGRGGSGAPGGAGWDRGTCRGKEEEQGHLDEEDGTGALVEWMRRNRGTGEWDRGTGRGEEEEQEHLKKEDEKGPQIMTRRYKRALSFTLLSFSTNWVINFSMIRGIG
jgi:hypothetical protein